VLVGCASSAARLAGAGGPDGIVLTSSVTVTPSGATDRESIADVDVSKIVVPSQLVHNERDACKASPPDGATALAANLKKSKLVTVNAGDECGSDACGPLTYHGFYGPGATTPGESGLEDEVVPKIVAFVSGH
jgi:hypothetical protein